MPFSLRELHWMMEAKTELNTTTLTVIIDAIFQSMANQMAITKAVATGKRASPDEFYKSPNRKRKRQTTEGVNKAGFAAMKALFVKG